MRIDRLARPDAGTILAQALIEDAAVTGLDCTVVHWRPHAWASATFTGWRHEALLIVAQGSDADAWLTALPEREFALRTHLLADLAVTRRADFMVDLVALTIDRG